MKDILTRFEKHQTPRRVDVMAYAAFVLLTLVAYGNTLFNGFTFDDQFIIIQNESVKELRRLPYLFVEGYWAGTGEDEPLDSGGSLYRPLTLLTYAANYFADGLRPFGYHLVNLVLAMLVAAAFYRFALDLEISRPAAVGAGLLFVVHPIHTEAVSSVVGRAELIMGLGVFWSMHLYCAFYYERKVGLAKGCGTLVWSWLAFAGALLSKEQAVVLPFLLVLLDLMKSAPPSGAPAWLKFVSTRYAVYGVILVAYLGARSVAVGNYTPGSFIFRPPDFISYLDNPLAHVSGSVRALTALKVSGLYLWLFVWPQHLSNDYSFNAIPLVQTFFGPEVLLPILVWIGLLALGLWSFLYGSKRIFFAVGFTVVAFLPSSNLIVPIGTIMGERLFFLPSAGLVLLLACLWDVLAKWMNGSRFEIVGKTGGLVVFFIVLLAATTRTIIRNRDWRDNKALFESAALVNPQSAKVQYNLGVLEDDTDKALERYQRARDIYPHYAALNASLGAVLIKKDRMDEALEVLQRAVKMKTRRQDAHYNLGFVYSHRGEWRKAEEAYHRALVLDFEDAATHNSLSFVYRQQERYDEALEAANQALQLKPTFIEAHYNRGRALEALGRREQAIKAYLEVLKLKKVLGVEKRVAKLRAQLVK